MSKPRLSATVFVGFAVFFLDACGGAGDAGDANRLFTEDDLAAIVRGEADHPDGTTALALDSDGT